MTTDPKAEAREKERRPHFSALPPGTLTVLAEVMHTGAAKYGRFNWRAIGEVKDSTYVDAAMGHLLDYMNGKEFDDDSGMPVLMHVAATCLVLEDARQHGVLIKDVTTEERPGVPASILKSKSEAPDTYAEPSPKMEELTK